MSKEGPWTFRLVHGPVSSRRVRRSRVDDLVARLGPGGDIPVHEWSWLVFSWARGFTSRQFVIDKVLELTGVALSTQALADMDVMEANYVARSNVNRAFFRAEMEASVGLFEAGLLTEAQFRTHWGL